MLSTAALITSQKRNSRIPTAIALRNARSDAPAPVSRPTGKPMKIVAPAMIPSTTICSCGM